MVGERNGGPPPALIAAGGAAPPPPPRRAARPGRGGVGGGGKGRRAAAQARRGGPAPRRYPQGMAGAEVARTAAVDDYIKTIYAVDERGTGPATTTALAKR